MSYAIICDARKGGKLGVDTLALVDRSKSRRLWWTSDNPRIAISYRSRDAAEFAAGRLRRNRARVVPFDQAVRILNQQAEGVRDAEREFEHQSALAACEEGWDGHKLWTA